MIAPFPFLFFVSLLLLCHTERFYVFLPYLLGLCLPQFEFVIMLHFAISSFFFFTTAII